VATDERSDRAPAPADGASAACPYRAGARARETLPPSSLLPAQQEWPIRHVIVLMQENRSFDHYFGRLAAAGQPDAEGFPPDYSNLDPEGRRIRPFHLPSTCVPADPPHQWEQMHAHWAEGRMDGFVTAAAAGRTASAGLSSHPPHDEAKDDDEGEELTAGGRYAIGYYDRADLPFYYFLASTFTVADRYFSPVMAGTWPNRQFLYTGTAQRRGAPAGVLHHARTIFDSLDAAHTSWAVYTDGPPRQDCIGWSASDSRTRPVRDLRRALASGKLPAVSFLDPAVEDEHPPADVQRGEAWARRLYAAILASPAWPELALFITYDEGGGFFDHVPPPPACPPSADRPQFDRRGTRVPFLVVSPWARSHHVSHVVHDHTSVLRFIELLFDLPALSDRDANADALLDTFDFSAPPRLIPPPAPPAGAGGCHPGRLVARR